MLTNFSSANPVKAETGLPIAHAEIRFDGENVEIDQKDYNKYKNGIHNDTLGSSGNNVLDFAVGGGSGKTGIPEGGGGEKVSIGNWKITRYYTPQKGQKNYYISPHFKIIY